MFGSYRKHLRKGVTWQNAMQKACRELVVMQPRDYALMVRPMRSVSFDVLLGVGQCRNIKVYDWYDAEIPVAHEFLLDFSTLCMVVKTKASKSVVRLMVEIFNSKFIIKL